MFFKMWEYERVIGITFLTLALIGPAHLEPKGFILTAPAHFGSEEVVCISFKNSSVPEIVTITLLEHKSDVVLASVEQRINGSSECLTVRVPPRLPHDTPLARLLVRITSPDRDSAAVLSAVRTVTLIQDPWLTFIATDKPVYGSNDVVRIRLFSINSDFYPLLDKVEKVWVENPQGVHVGEWDDVKSVGGFIDLSFPLVAEPFPGTWAVKMSRHGHIQTRSFLVQRHVLPSFKVTLTLPNAVEAEVPAPIKVCAKYTFGQPVHGTVLVTMAVECSFKFYCSNETEPAAMNLTLGADGCADSDIVAERADGPVWQYMLLTATVEESGTGVRGSQTGKLSLLPPGAWEIVSGAFKHVTTRVKPGLPFYGKFELTSKLNKTSHPNVTVELCQSLDDEKWCTTVATDSGEVPFVIPPRFSPDKPTEKIVLQAAWSGPDLKSMKKHSYLRPWFSPSSSYVQIQSHLFESPLRCGQNITVQVFHTMSDEENLEFFVMVKSRGNVQLFEVLSAMPDYEERVLTQADSPGVVSLGPPQTSDRTVQGFSFTLPVTVTMAPAAALVIYTVRSDGEVVADSAILRIEHCFENHAALAWSVAEGVPGADISLRVEADAGSVCAVSAVDKKVDLWAAEVLPLRSVVYRELAKKFKLTHASDHVYDKDKCIKEPAVTESGESYVDQSLTMSQEPTSIFVDTLDAFENSGLLVISDLTVVTRPCRNFIVQPKTSGPADVGPLDVSVPTEWDFEDEDSNRIPSEEPVVSTRSHFPDTWIWDLVHVGESGIQALEAKLPDSVTEWTARVACLSRKSGLTEAESQVIRSFQPFFLDFSVPQAIKRHELLHLPVTVFNYMDTPIPVMLAIEPTEHLHVRSELTSSVCIARRSKAVVMFRVVPVKLGTANISIKAEVDPHAADECGPALHDYKVDHVMKQTIVKAEGQVIEEVRSALICGKDVESSSGPQPGTIDWSMKMSSSDYVDQTVTSEARVSGDVFGPTLTGVENLIQKPTGCGEQNVLAFAPNLLLVRYLLNRYPVGVVGDDVTKALRHVEAGYQQQLGFRHLDGSYSAFGPGVDTTGSIWLTAFVLLYFNEMKPFVRVDEADLDASLQWVLKQQLENGCFPMVGEVYHWDVKRRLSGADSPRALTAFILISLLKSGLSPSADSVKNAMFCVQASHPEDLYGDLLTAYALALAGEDREARWRMRQLLKASNRSYQTLWWEQLEDGSSESSIEMTSYGVLTLIKLGTPQFLSAAADAIRWILKFQNKNGGFLSTQDTIIALEAIAEYSETLPRSENTLRVTLEYASGNSTFEINEKNRQLQQISRLPPFLTRVQFSAEGSGCALVQTVIKYNIRRGSPSKTLKLQLRVDPAGQSDDLSMRRVEACVRTRSGNPYTGMAVVEINLPTGFYPDRASLYRVVSTQKGVKKFEEFEDHVNFYIDELTNHKRCIFFMIKRELCVENLSSVLAKVYDYYNSKYFSSVRYQIQQSCNDSRTVDSWLKPDTAGETVNGRRRRDVDATAKSGPFANFKDVSHDLEAPNLISSRFEVFAMPPPSKKENQKCPQCLSTLPDIFPMLYCSSQLSAKVRFRGAHLLEVLQDLSPQSKSRNETDVRRTVAYTMKRRCACEAVPADDTLALLMVTPPRTFNLRALQVVHLDDSITLFPWNATFRHRHLLSDPSTSCSDVLTSS